MSFSRVLLHRPESALAVEKMSLQRDYGAATYQKCSQLCALSDNLAGILSTAEGWVRPLVNLAFSSPSLQFFWRPQGRIACFCKKASLTNFLPVEKKKENKLYTSCKKLARWSEVKMCFCGLIFISQLLPCLPLCQFVGFIRTSSRGRGGGKRGLIYRLPGCHIYLANGVS